ncbi:hypothetical protein Trydic_g1625 [Trypoxylus dichotomus]
MCNHLYSGNATNFKGDYNELKQLRTFLQDGHNQSKITTHLISREITWHFIPPKSLHLGGLWESAVHSVKYHIKLVVGKTLLAFGGYATILSQIECCLNSRPISPISNHPSDLSPFTPLHLLLVDFNTAQEVYDVDLTKLPTNKLSKWQMEN